MVQSVFRTFFRRLATGELHLKSAGGLWPLLVKITLRKAAAKARYHTAVKRDVRSEAGDAGAAALAWAAAREPGPEEAAVLVDEIEALPQGEQGTDRSGEIGAVLVDEIEALLQGLPPLHARVLGCGSRATTPPR